MPPFARFCGTFHNFATLVYCGFFSIHFPTFALGISFAQLLLLCLSATLKVEWHALQLPRPSFSFCLRFFLLLFFFLLLLLPLLAACLRLRLRLFGPGRADCRFFFAWRFLCFLFFFFLHVIKQSSAAIISEHNRARHSGRIDSARHTHTRKQRHRRRHNSSTDNCNSAEKYAFTFAD